ncbi:MAG: NAD(P)-binding domain-containing protein [Myxococcota bacterium]
MTQRPPMLRRAGAIASDRRRSAPDAEVTSDERRFVGVGLATLVGFLVTLAVAMGSVEPQSLQSPGPLARPHVRAAVSCAACHEDTSGQARPPQTACVGCHGPHPSARAGHRAMVERGLLSCTSCHRVHRDMGGVAYDGQGDPLRFGPGDAVPVAVDGAHPVGSTPWVVPVIPAEVCGTCHKASTPGDPIARCLLGGQGGLSQGRPSACFDEHRRVDGLTIRDDATRGRLAIWAVAREVLVRRPVAPQRRPAPAPAWSWLWSGLLAAGVTWIGARGVQRLVDRRRKPPVSQEVAAAVPEIQRLPVVNTATCIGCYACVDACPYDVLAIERYVAKVVRPDDCCGLTLCEQRCPNGSLVVTDGDPIDDRPAIDAALQSTEVPGLFLAGDLTGLPLIRNAINQGATAIDGVVASLRGTPSHHAPLDVVIVGAGPAGVSAALAALKHGLRYQVVEQGSVAESIRSFPRGKLVFDQPLGLPMVGDLWLAEATKEELVGKWLRIVRQKQLAILEQTRVTGVQRDPQGAFVVHGQPHGPHDGRPVAWTAARVVLAIGRRGTPRKLGVELPDAVLSRVHYSMADARSFAGQRVIVVGLGDVAMEAAVALSRQQGTEVIVCYRGDAFSRGKQRNIDELRRRVAAGRVQLRMQTTIGAVGPDTVTVRGPDGDHALAWDAMLVMIGSIAPWDFLAAAGVHRAGDPARAEDGVG